MGRLIFGMLQSLDGYIAGPSGGPQSGGVLSSQAAALFPPPGPIVSRYFVEHVRGLNGMFYGRRIYEVMRYWDEDKPDWDEGDHDFARVWRPKPKWIASRTLTSVGPNATLVQEDVLEFAARLKSEMDGDIDVAGSELANVLSAARLIDEYCLYLRPYVLGGGKPYFAGPVPPLRLVKHEAIGEDTLRLIYVPA